VILFYNVSKWQILTEDSTVANRINKNVSKFQKRNKWLEGEGQGKDKKRYKKNKRQDNGKRKFLDEDEQPEGSN